MKLEEKRWVAEVEIPFSNFVYAPGQTHIGANFIRFELGGSGAEHLGFRF